MLRVLYRHGAYRSISVVSRSTAAATYRMLPKVRHQSSKAEPSVVNEDIVKDHALPPEDVQSIGQARITSRDLFSLKGRTIVVTGAGRGLGIALAAGVLRAGGDVVCLDVLPKPSEREWAGLEDIAKDTNKAKYHQCDITQEEEVKKILITAAAEATARGNPIRGLISCAGIQQMVDAVDYPISDFKRIFDVNVTGSFVVAKSIAGLMKEANTGGSLVLIASMSGQIANRGIHCSAYNSSKAAVQQMSRSLAMEWGRHGIRVNSLSPGYIKTAMTAQLLDEKPDLEKTWMAGALLGRLGAVEDFEAPAVYLLADGSSFMTGSDLRVDGGHCASA